MDEQEKKVQTAEAQAAPAEGGKRGKKKEKVKKTVGQEILSWVGTILCAVLVALLIRTFLFEPVRVDGHSMDNTLADGEIVFVSKLPYSSTWLCLPWADAATQEASSKFTIGEGPSRFDVVICRYPGRGGTNFVKRVVGLPGDTVELKDGYLYVNGERYEEAYINEAYRTGSSNTFGPYQVPAKGDVLQYEDGVFKLNGETIQWTNPNLSGLAENGDRLEITFANRKATVSLNGKELDSSGYAQLEGKEFKLEKDFYFVMGDHRNNSNDSRMVGPIERNMIIGKVRFVIFPFNKWGGVQ